jgi:type I restriction enzyme M protein
LREGAPWTYDPPVGDANYAWLEHQWPRALDGTAGVVLSNGYRHSGEDVIGKAMVEADVVDCMINAMIQVRTTSSSRADQAAAEKSGCRWS